MIPIISAVPLYLISRSQHRSPSNSSLPSPFPGYGPFPLYPDSHLTATESFVSTMQFFLHHKLSNIGLDHLVKLIAMHLPEGHLMPETEYLFKKFFAELEMETVLHFYCGCCSRPLKSKKDSCSVCQKKVIKFYAEFPLQSQLARLFSDPEFFEALRYPFTRTKSHPDHLEDFIDGDLYQSQGKFLSSYGHLSFSWNTDGVSIFKSSPFNLWPVMLKINTLPPRLRQECSSPGDVVRKREAQLQPVPLHPPRQLQSILPERLCSQRSQWKANSELRSPPS